LNPNGIDGPTLKQIFICEGCKWLSMSILGSLSGTFPFKCFHNELLPGGRYDNQFNLLKGDIGIELITPDWCPYLLKKIRTEKLKELNNEYRRTEETSA